MKTLKLTYTLLACAIFLISCKKNPGEPSEPEPLLNRLDTVKYSPYGSHSLIKYNEDGLIKDIIVGESITYTYNPNKTVKTVVTSSYSNEGHTIYEYKVNYEDGLPVSGRLKIQPPNRNSNTPVFFIDSIKYKTIANKVTELKSFDRKVYSSTTGQLNGIETDTISATRYTYVSDNLTKTEFIPKQGAIVISEYTYGTRNGISSANRMKFVVTGNESPTLLSKNELLSSLATYGYGIPYWEKIVYTYQYNKAGFPKTAEILYTRSAGTLTDTRTASYHYK